MATNTSRKRAAYPVFDEADNKHRGPSHPLTEERRKEPCIDPPDGTDTGVSKIGDACEDDQNPSIRSATNEDYSAPCNKEQGGHEAAGSGGERTIG